MIKTRQQSMDFGAWFVIVAVVAILAIAVTVTQHTIQEEAQVTKQQNQWIQEHGPRLLKIMRGEHSVQKAILLCGLEVGQLCPGDCARRFHVDAPDAPFGKLKD